MKKLILLCALALAAAPVAAFADDQPPAADVQTAQKICAQQRQQLRDADFKALYGTNANKSNAFGKCVSKLAKAAEQNDASAATTCKAEQNDPNFAAAHGGKSFDQLYGNDKGKGAFGKCVASESQAESQDESAATVNAAKACAAERKSDPAAFAKTYGKNGNKRNAFGKCVSQQVKQQQAPPTP